MAYGDSCMRAVQLLSFPLIPPHTVPYLFPRSCSFMYIACGTEPISVAPLPVHVTASSSTGSTFLPQGIPSVSWDPSEPSSKPPQYTTEWRHEPGQPPLDSSTRFVYGNVQQHDGFEPSQLPLGVPFRLEGDPVCGSGQLSILRRRHLVHSRGMGRLPG